MTPEQQLQLARERAAARYDDRFPGRSEILRGMWDLGEVVQRELRPIKELGHG